MSFWVTTTWKLIVALFTEGVDWNFVVGVAIKVCFCRPLHRGCGLKSQPLDNSVFVISVALFTEGVDWNISAPLSIDWKEVSPSSQRVWIEIKFLPKKSAVTPRRPLHRGCGLKYLYPPLSIDWGSRPLHRGCGLKSQPLNNSVFVIRSPSSQRVWIEILLRSFTVKTINVALFTEGVDWNIASLLYC